MTPSAGSSPFEPEKVAARRARGWRLLVVDDEAAVRRSLERYLGGAGFTVVVAADVDEALDQLSREPVAAVVLDVRMPDITGRHRTGLEVLSYLRLQPALRTIPAIVFTGYAPTGEQQAEIQLQHGEVLHKGQSLAGLVERLDELLR